MRQDWQAFATRPVPRYTSYPTAVDFSPELEGETVCSWAAGVEAGAPISVYTHVPFCEKLCWYCGCATSVPNGYDRVSAYVDVLHKEIDLWAAALGPQGGMGHLHFGGGSPNALSPEDFIAIVDHQKRAFGLADGAEIAVELDPRTMTDSKLVALSVAGVSRVSLGVQTLAPHVQRAVNRIQPREMIEKMLSHLAYLGIDKVNMDLMYGLPDQTTDDMLEAAQFAAQTASRVSVFGYAHVPWFAKHQKAIDEAALPGLMARYEQAAIAHDVLTKAGFAAIGLDHYARADDSLAIAQRAGRLRRNFQGYTDDPCATLVGLGATSIGQFREGYVQNHKGRNEWREAILSGVLPVERGLELTTDDRLRARAIERLMCDLSVDVNDVCVEMGAGAGSLSGALELARELEPAGLCVVDGAVVTVPEEARVMLRTVAQCFDARSIPSTGRHAKAV